MKSLDDIDQKLFNWAVDLGHKMIDRGYARAWFSWLEWIGLTALLHAAARRLDSIFLHVVAFLSAIMLFFVGLAGVEKLRDALLPTLKGGWFLILVVGFGISILGLWVVSDLLFKLLAGSTP